MTNYQLKKSAVSSKNWVNTLNSLKIQQKNSFTPQNSNLYAYAANNPVKYTDPDGNWILNTNLFCPNKMYQNNNKWDDHQFVNFENKTIGQLGCALTVMANGFSALANYQSLVTNGPAQLGYNPDFMNNMASSDNVGANWEKFTELISSQLGLKATLVDTNDIQKVKDAKTSKTATLVFAHMKTKGPEGEHWININAINEDGTFNGSDVLADSSGENPKKDYTRSNPSNYDRFIIITVEIE